MNYYDDKMLVEALDNEIGKMKGFFIFTDNRQKIVALGLKENMIPVEIDILPERNDFRIANIMVSEYIIFRRHYKKEITDETMWIDKLYVMANLEEIVEKEF